MSKTTLANTAGRGTSVGKRFMLPFSKRQILDCQKQSDEWHQQIEFSAHALRPTDKRFPWTALQKHTDDYLSKKGRITQPDIDIRLTLLIETHTVSDVAIAACGHAMSPQSLRALLNVELNVSPVSYYGLEMYLQCLVAANYCNQMSVTEVEAAWAVKLLPYATHGLGAARRFLEGLCELSNGSNLPNLSALPHFSILVRRSIRDFASQLEGMKLRCQWLTAYNCTAWMRMLAKNSPASTPPGHILLEHMLDAQFLTWRVWSSWRPNLVKILNLDSMDNLKRGLLPDLLCLEGPDFVGGLNATLRDGLVAQYGAMKPLVTFRNIIIEVPSCKKKELADILNRSTSVLEMLVSGETKTFDLFARLIISRPIRLESFKLVEAILEFPSALHGHISKIVLETYMAQSQIGGQHINALCQLIMTLNDARGEDLRQVVIRPWLLEGLDKCYRECRVAVRTQIDAGLAWTDLALELHGLSHTLRTSEHCLPLLGSAFRAQLDVLPSLEDLKIAIEIYQAIGGRETACIGDKDTVATSLEAWCIDRLISRGVLRKDPGMTAGSIIWFWKTTTDLNRRRLALVISHQVSDAMTRRECFTHIHELSDELISQFLTIMDNYRNQPEQSCTGMAMLLGKIDSNHKVRGFRSIIYNQLRDLDDHLLDYNLTSMKAWEWISWILCLETLFADFHIDDGIGELILFSPSLRKWTRQLSQHIPTLTRLEEYLGHHHSTIQYFLRGGDIQWEKNLMEILEIFTMASVSSAEGLMLDIIGKLTYNEKNAHAMTACCRSLLQVSGNELGICHRLLASVHDETIPKVVVEIIVAGYLQDELMRENDKTAIMALAVLLELETHEMPVPEEKLLQTAKYYRKLEECILEEADRLEGVTKELKARDPRGTAMLLEQLGIKDINPLDDELMNLPVGVIDAVERWGPNEIEISFPLATFTDLERAAMGIGTARTLLVHMFIDRSTDMPPNFCTHLDNEGSERSEHTEEVHTPWICLDGVGEPVSQFCTGRCTTLTWQLNRVLHRRLATNEDLKIAELHEFVTQSLQILPHCCVVCGISHDARQAILRRSIPCQSSSCMAIWNKTPLEVRIPEIRSDPFAVDMLLTGVYAAALSGRIELLPDCPIKTTQKVTALLNKLPSISTLQKSTSPITEIIIATKEDNRAAESLLSWTCTHYRGFVASARGICKIPSLPVGTHQFILANASPALEKDFTGKLSRHRPTTRVLFHGTSLDRLPSILSQGLRTLSGTSLQRTGAAHGKGIYLAEDPATSFGYSPFTVSWRNSGLNNMRVLLGCEVAGNGRKVSGGIHVVTDEKSVMVRYIFLFTPGASSPNANHITTPMLSALSALRTGSV